MQEQLLRSLLKASSDFILVVNSSGEIIELGDHFLAVLEERGLDRRALVTIVAGQAEKFSQNDGFHFTLKIPDFFCSPFSILSQDDGRMVLLATDLNPQQAFIRRECENRGREQVFREKEERIHVLLDESSDPIVSFAADGTYLYVNRIFAQTVGRKQQDIIGRKIWDVFSKEEADKRFAMVRQVFETGETGTIEVRVPLPDGGEKYFLTTVKPIRNCDQQVSFIICISKDITALRRAQHEIVLLQGIIPICASCKSIRNDAGYWQQIEDYISTHSGVEFSHGLCPGCVEKLYPGLVDAEEMEKSQMK